MIVRNGIAETREWTEEDINTLFRLLNEGNCLGQCAEKMDRTHQSVRNARHRYGNRKPEWNVEFLPSRAKWSPVELQILIDGDGKTDAQLAELLPFRTVGAVGDMRKRLRWRGHLKTDAAAPVPTRIEEARIPVEPRVPFTTVSGITAFRKRADAPSIVYLPSVYG